MSAFAACRSSAARSDRVGLEIRCIHQGQKRARRKRALVAAGKGPLLARPDPAGNPSPRPATGEDVKFPLDLPAQLGALVPHEAAASCWPRRTASPSVARHESAGFGQSDRRPAAGELQRRQMRPAGSALGGHDRSPGVEPIGRLYRIDADRTHARGGRFRLLERAFFSPDGRTMYHTARTSG